MTPYTKVYTVKGTEDQGQRLQLALPVTESRTLLTKSKLEMIQKCILKVFTREKWSFTTLKLISF